MQKNNRHRFRGADCFNVGWEMGFEPTIFSATNWRVRPTTLHPPYMARLKGLEPLAPCLEGRCSIQLSYRRLFVRSGGVFGAGDGNRTHTTSLEGWGSTTELHPQMCFTAWTIIPHVHRDVKYHFSVFSNFSYLFWKIFVENQPYIWYHIF